MSRSREISVSSLLVAEHAVSSPTEGPKGPSLGLTNRPSRREAENAVRTLLRWAGDDPAREGLLETPSRVVRAWEEWCCGYDKDPEDYLRRTFEEVGGYDEMITLKNITFESHCEHHLAAILGRVHVAYLPDRRVVGISKLARIVDIYAKRLQIQEKMTAQIANAIQEVLEPKSRRCHRGRAWVYDNPWRSQARNANGDEPYAWGVS